VSHAAAALPSTLGLRRAGRGTAHNPALMAWLAVSSAATAVRAAKHKSSPTCLGLYPVEEKTTPAGKNQINGGRSHKNKTDRLRPIEVFIGLIHRRSTARFIMKVSCLLHVAQERQGGLTPERSDNSRWILVNSWPAP
tara:strand:- start:251 stop:664 length:414 start_codon:yes stop_codon:yes gene_type:complete